MSNRTEDDIYEEIIELGPRSVAYNIYELERENIQLRADLEKCVEALNHPLNEARNLQSSLLKGKSFSTPPHRQF